MIDKLRQINNGLIQKNASNKEELKKQKLIQKLLKDDNCFFKIGIEVAFGILKDLGFENEDLTKVYSELIDGMKSNKSMK